MKEVGALGEWVEFTATKGKKLIQDENITEGVVVSVGEDAGHLLGQNIKKGDKVLVSTVKQLQYLIDGETRYYVNANSVMKKL